jgi:intracellular septation protein
VIIVIFGSATLILQDETFIKWKPSVLYWSFAAVLSLAALFWNKNLIRSIMGQQITLPDPVWRILNHAWAGFFAALGIANLYVAFNFATDTWVNFKLFGTTGLMLTFVIAQSLFIAKYMKEPEQCSMSSSNDGSNNQEKP